MEELRPEEIPPPAAQWRLGPQLQLVNIRELIAGAMGMLTRRDDKDALKLLTMAIYALDELPEAQGT